MAAIPVMRTWAAGLLSASHLNIDMRDTLNFMLNPPMAIVRREKPPDVILSNGPWDDTLGSRIKFDTIVRDTDGGWNSDENRYYAQTPGWYVLGAVLQLKEEQFTGTFISRWFAFLKNSLTAQDAIQRFPPSSASRSVGYVLTGMMSMNVGDHVSLVGAARVNDATVVGYDGVNYFGCQFEIRWASKL